MGRRLQGRPPGTTSGNRWMLAARLPSARPSKASKAEPFLTRGVRILGISRHNEPDARRVGFGATPGPQG